MNYSKSQSHKRKQSTGGNAESVEKEEGFSSVVKINRCAKVVKGGRRFSFAAIMVVGDCKGNVGTGNGKAKDVPECIRKATEDAKRSMKGVQLRKNTIPHEVIGKSDGGRVLLRPASPGTGVIAGSIVGAVLKAAGIEDVLSKSLGSNTPQALVNATMDALSQLRSAEQIRAIKQAP